MFIFSGRKTIYIIFLQSKYFGEKLIEYFDPLMSDGNKRSCILKKPVVKSCRCVRFSTYWKSFFSMGFFSGLEYD